MFTTHPTLLAGIKQGDAMSWYQFRDRYRPLIFHCARQTGVAAADIPELEQNVLVALFKACRTFEYDPAKGKFRTYFGALVRNCIVQIKRKHCRERRTAMPPMDSELAEDLFEQRWILEWRQHIFWLALLRARAELPGKMVRIFELCDVRGVAPAMVASSMKVSPATVYNYRHRVLEALRVYVAELQVQE